MKRLLLIVFCFIATLPLFSANQFGLQNVWLVGGNYMLLDNIFFEDAIPAQTNTVVLTVTGTEEHNEIDFNGWAGLSKTSGGATINFVGSLNKGFTFKNAATSVFKIQSANLTFSGPILFTGVNAHGDGGALNAGASTAVVFQTRAKASFVQNYVTGNGGAAYVAGANSNINFGDSVLFDGNSASLSGGAVYVSGDTVSSALIFNGLAQNIFRNNSAVQNGGAIGVSNNRRGINIGGASFENNTSGGHGGAIYLDRSNLTLRDKIKFSGNSSSGNGGAIRLSLGVLDIEGTGNVFSGNSARDNGGALAIYGGPTAGNGPGTANVYNASFYNNSAEVLGGAIYLESGRSSTATANFNFFQTDTTTPSVFKGNTSMYASNAIEMVGNSSAAATSTFDVTAGASVEMYDGIEGNEYSAFTKKGDGAFNLYGSMQYFSGDLTVDGGSFAVNSSAPVNADSFTLTSGSLNTASGYASAMTFNNMQTSAGTTLNLNAGGRSDSVTVTNSAVLDGALHVTGGLGLKTGDVITLISADAMTGALTGDLGTYASFTQNSVLSGTINHRFDFVGNSIILTILFSNLSTEILPGMIASGLVLSENQRAVVAALDSGSRTASGDLALYIEDLALMTPEEQAVLTREVAGYFPANVAAIPLYENPRSEVLDRLKNHCVEGYCTNDGVWAQATGNKTNMYGNANSPGDLKSLSYGAAFGWDRYVYENAAMYGFFGKYAYHDIEQEYNSAAAHIMTLGAYGLIEDYNWAFSGVLSAGAAQNQTERPIPSMSRKAEADFFTFNLGADLTASYNLRLGRHIKISPFVGAEGSALHYPDFEEKDAGSVGLDVRNGYMFYGAARTGLGLDFQNNWLTLYAGADIRYLLYGREPQITARFSGGRDWFDSKGFEMSRWQYGLNAGAEVEITSNWRAFVNGGALLSSHYKDYNANIGVRYAFCGPSYNRAAPSGAYAGGERVLYERSVASNQMPVSVAQGNKPEGRFVELPVNETIGSLYFNKDVSELGPNQRNFLTKAAAMLKKQDFFKLVITGNTDNTEADSVALDRARNTYDFLMRAGVPADKMTFRGAGSSMPVGSNSDEAGRKANRRVFFSVQ